ncbi:MAG: META domain-containing protein, partial [Dehalococcoidia bacterium]|nr:META domain-containing protein [Dehalococcoidia bacterium]
MRKTQLTVVSLLILGAVTLATVVCGGGRDPADAGQAPGIEHTESPGATVVAEDAPSVARPTPVSRTMLTPAALAVVATTTEPTYITTADLDNAPTGSSDGRSKIVAHSTLVLVGTVSQGEPRVERISGRFPGDPSRPDPSWTTLAYVHDVQIELYLKGNGPDTLSVMQPTGHENVSPGSGATPGFLYHVRYSAHNFYFEGGGRYLLFLRESEHAPGLWMGTAEPYKYLFTDGRARARTPLKNPDGLFSTRLPKDDVVGRVKEVIDYQSAFASSGIPNGVRWNLESLDGRPRLEGTFIALTVDGNSYGGGDGCNSFGGRTEGGVPVAGKNGSFSGSARGTAETLMLCVSRDGSDGIMKQAEAYKRAVRSGRTFQIDGDRLKILDGSGKVRLIFTRRATLPGQPVELADTQWRMVDEKGDYGDIPPPTLAFLNEHLAAGTTACRDFILDYTVGEDGSLSFSGKGRYGPADSCTEEMVELERSFRRGLSSDDYAVDDSSGESVLRI